MPFPIWNNSYQNANEMSVMAFNGVPMLPEAGAIHRVPTQMT